jgi:hypothetical protein
MYLRSFKNKVFLTILFSVLGLVGFAQEDDEYWKKLLNEEVEVANPVYKPVISIGAGVLGFFGDVKNPGANVLLGKNGFKLNVSTLVGKKNYFKFNGYVLIGSLSGHDFDISRQMQLSTLPLDNLGDVIYPNSSFSTDIYQIGVNLEYGFAHKNAKQFRPFISIGFSPIFFSPKGNINYTKPDGTLGYYYFWSDGTMRNFSQSSADAWHAKIIPFDRKYETDLSSAKFYSNKSYSQNSFSIPIEFGFDFYLSYRVNLRVATTVNYTLSDVIDNYDSKIAKKIGLKGKGYNDIFTFTYFSMNFDLFSDPKSIMIEKMFADLDNYDYEVLLADQDNDGILDVMDKCPDTPNGVAVDSISGCPFDADKDGIYDYMDKEENTPTGATVDDSGVQLSQEKLSEMFDHKNAVLRKEIRVVPVAPIWTRNISFTPGVIPDKFKSVDADGDGYISFTELLKAVDDYFDDKTSLKPEDVYDLNNYFFSQ